MPRPTVDEILMSNALQWARRSVCPSRSVGALIARDGRIVSTGYNGPVSGQPHPPIEGNTCNSCVHAEQNAILWAARHGFYTRGASIYTSTSPCLACANSIAQAGIRSVYFHHEYRDLSGIAALGRYNIPVTRITSC